MKPTFIDLKDYELSGGGKLGESYNKKDDPDILLKLYSTELEKMGLDEYERARKVYDLGLPCPEPGQLVRTTDNRVGIQFKRIHGKLSYARALSIHPERMEQYAAEFAELCKKLHSTTPPPGLFPTFKDQSRQYITENPFLTDEERSGILHFIDSQPDADTALHGDLHIGNVIFDDKGQKYLIDLSEFSTGSHMFDLGIIYLQCCFIPNEVEMELYHITKDVSVPFWNLFIKNYIGPDTDVEEFNKQILPYALLRILCVEKMMGYPVPPIRPAVHKLLGIK
ncbi:MAG: phosphotransferase [Bacteroidaceae bacterium]|nr:phosphotransferase [Bacteroidaceae bacterium]